jgi:hypothetical protein
MAAFGDKYKTYAQQPVIRNCRAVRVLMSVHLASLVGNPTSKRHEKATAYTGERWQQAGTRTYRNYQDDFNNVVLQVKKFEIIPTFVHYGESSKYCY